MKLSKSQKELIRIAKKQNGRVGICYGVEYKKEFGNRDRKAAVKLSEMGIIEKVWSSSESSGYGKYGVSIGFSTSVSYKLV